MYSKNDQLLIQLILGVSIILPQLCTLVQGLHVTGR